MTATGVGSMAAALFLATRRRASAWAIAVGATTLGLGLVAVAMVPSLVVALPALVMSGAGAVWMAANGNTLIQSVVPDELRGRVMSVYTTIFAGSTPIGALIAGALASALGAAAALGIGGILTLLVGGSALLWLRAHPGVARAAGTAAPRRILPAMTVTPAAADPPAP